MHILFCFLLIGFITLSFSDTSVDNSDLIMTFIVHRHGDKTPVPGSFPFNNDIESLKRLSAKFGYGQLTDLGKHHGYQLGHFIRNRYGILLSKKYNTSEIYIRSTDSTLAKMTALVAMAAVYPAGRDNWSPFIQWTPVPYTTVPVKYDYNLATFNCPVYSSYFTRVMMSPHPGMAKYEELLEKISTNNHYNFTHFPMMVYVLHDVYNSQISLEVLLEPEMEKILPELEIAAADVLDIIFDHKNNAALNAGVLLNEFFNAADKVIAGENAPRVIIYSAHDLNVYSFQAVTKAVPRQGVPKYASAFALELRRTNSGRYIVVPVYLSSPSSNDIKFLMFEGCDRLCQFDNFRKLTARSQLDEKQWRQLCEFDEDYDFYKSNHI